MGQDHHEQRVLGSKIAKQAVFAEIGDPGQLFHGGTRISVLVYLD